MTGVTVNACVVDANAAPASERLDGDPLEVRPTLGRGTGFAALQQRVLECGPGRSGPIATGDREEVMFVLEGAGTLVVDGAAHELEPESGAHLAPGERYELRNAGPGTLRIISVQIPEPAPGDTVAQRELAAQAAHHATTQRELAAQTASTQREVVRKVADQAAQPATTEREFRIVADPSTGLRSATHFVGYVPAARAPGHFHAYDEVIYVLDGEGVLHVDGVAHPLAPGSCVQLPARTVHCLQNTGADVLRLVAVFRPAGSPAAAYYPDGTPAHPAAAPLEPA